MGRKEDNDFSVNDLVAYYKYCKQDFNPRLKYKLPVDRIKTDAYYKRSKKYFDKLFELIVKYGIDYVKFMNYCIYELRSRDPSDMLDVNCFRKYGNYLAREEQYKRIFEYYNKSANYIADQTIARGYNSCSLFIRDLVISNRLAEEYVCGNISKYYLSSLQNFDKIYSKLDSISKDELSTILKVKDVLNKDVQDAFLKLKQCKVTPIRYTDTIIKNKTKQNNK